MCRTISKLLTTIARRRLLPLFLLSTCLASLAPDAFAWGWPKPGTFEPWYTGGKPLDEAAPSAQDWYKGLGKKWLFGQSTLMDNKPVLKGTGSELEILAKWESMTPEEQHVQQPAHCNGLMHAARLGDAFECAKALESDLFSRYYALENHKAIDRPTMSTNAYFGDVFVSVFEIYARYYLAIGDAASAEGYARLACELQSHSDYGELLDKHCLALIGVAQAARGDIAGARRTLDDIDGAYKHISVFARKQYEDLYKDSRLTVLFALQDWPLAAEVLEGYDPGVASTRSAKRHVVAGLIAGVIGTVLLVPDAASSLLDIAKAAPDIGNVLQNMQVEAVMLAHFRVAKVAFETGDGETAETTLDELLASPNIAMLPQTLQVSIRRDRAQLYAGGGDMDDARRLYYEAIDIIESQRSNLRTEAGRIGFLGDRQRVYGELVSLLVQAGDGVAAFNVAERAKARALVDLLASKQEFGGREGEPPAAVRYLDAARAARQRDLGETVETSEKTRGLLIDARDALAAKDPELASILVGTVPKTDAIRHRLAPGDVLLEFYGSDKDWYAFVATRDRLTVYPIEGAGLSSEVERLRRELQDPADRKHVEARAMYSRLITPLGESIVGREVTIVPHGVLHYVPFAALRSATGWWGEQVAIRVLPSASVLDYLPGHPGEHAGTMLAIGDPDLGNPAYDLPGAEAEVQALARLMPTMTRYFRGQATETRLRQEAGRYGRIHIASHGVFVPDRPLSSRLLLASDSQNDGNLTVPELYDLRLDADLVTLSACETGLGKVAAGDDMVGLTRGWLYAGARTIVASLWQVDDTATAMLMEHFYRALNAGRKPRWALQDAQAAVRKVYPAPFYWSAFQVTGSD
ncbi:MAG: CHAT domain-containing protein [Pseudomonadales bacterium]|nr:CHAT domain-containing protein [Pseudomonadales bacterium]